MFRSLRANSAKSNEYSVKTSLAVAAGDVRLRHGRETWTVKRALDAFLSALANAFYGDCPSKSLSVEDMLALRSLPFLTRMSSAQERYFFALCGRFLKEVEIRGHGDFVPTVEDRVKVAASCALLYAGRPEWTFPPVHTVVIAPHQFSEGDFEPRPDGKWAGFYRHADDSIHLHIGNMKYAFTKDADGYHLGIHEFAHALDAEDGCSDARLPYMHQDMIPLWQPILERERQLAASGKSVLRDYASTNLQETFATAVECFFEQPRQLRDKAADLYVLLAMYFNQDPAGEDSANPGGEVTKGVTAYLDELSVDVDVREGKIFWKDDELKARFRTSRGD